MRLATLLLLMVAGCANPINQRTATNYYQAGDAALARGDLVHAREMFSRALVNARLGHMGDRAEGQVLSKLGRVSGNLCDFDVAEKYLLEARDADIKAFAASPVMTLPSRLEIAQFSYDVGRYDKADHYFAEALAIGGVRLKEVDPVTYRAVLTDYANAADRVGSTDKARTLRAEAATIEQPTSGAVVGKGDSYVRYPKSCS
jgi:tetratricopeptide (TPR) repeat protein